ncbi:hypothetical protein GJAV_G00205920 [Gymnothorax javanicus]|nr:hypothetical protein GJAV_G00205920 [Gymnothorax javanicus]
MGTQGTGRKRNPNRERLTAEDDALNQIAREAEARLAAKRAARAEAREIRMKELERQQKEVSDDEERMSVGSRGSLRVEERSDRDFLEKGSRTASTLSAATLASLGGTSSRRGSGDTSLSVDTEASIREIKDSLVEVEEKYRKAMVSNAQLDNEKSNLMYQVDTLRDSLMELEEQLCEARRECEEKNKEFEREKHAHSILQFQFNEMKEMLKQSEELLTKHGIVLGVELTTNGEAGEGVIDGLANADSGTRLAQDSQTPRTGGDSMLGKIKETQLGGRDVDVMDGGQGLEKAEHPTVQLHKQRRVQTELLKEGVDKIIPDDPSEVIVTSQNSNSYDEMAEKESTEKVQSDSTVGGDEITPIDTEQNSDVESITCLDSTASPVCCPEETAVKKGFEEEMAGEGERTVNFPDHGESEVIDETSEDVSKGSNSAGYGEVDSAPENNVEVRGPVDEMIVKEKSMDGVEHESPSRGQDMTQEAISEGVENAVSFEDRLIQVHEMSEDAGESSALESHKNDIQETSKSQENSPICPQQESEPMIELKNREGSETGLEPAQMVGNHVDESRDLTNGEDEGNCSGLTPKELSAAKTPNTEQGLGSSAMDERELNSSDQKDEAQSGDLSTTALPQTPTPESSRQKVHEPPKHITTKTPQDHGSSSGKKKRKKKKKGKKAGVQESSSKACENPESCDGEAQETCNSAVEELAEQADMSSEELLASEKCDKTQICPVSTASVSNADRFENEEQSELSRPAAVVETQTNNDVEKENEDLSPETRETGSVSPGEPEVKTDSGEPEIINESDLKLRNTGDLEVEIENVLEREVENADDSEPGHVSTNIATCADMSSTLEQSSEGLESGTGGIEGCPQECQGTWEYVPSSPCISSEQLAATPSDTGTTEDTDSCKEAQSVMLEDPAVPLIALEETKPLETNLPGQELEDPERLTTPEEEIIVKVPPEGSMESQGAHQCSLLSPVTETGGLPAAASEVRTTEDIDGIEEAKSPVGEEPAGPLDIVEERQPSVENSVGQNEEDSKTVATPEQEVVVKTPPEDRFESQVSQEGELLSPSTETEELAAALPEAGNSGIGSSEEAESLVPEEPIGSPDSSEEKQPSLDNTVGEEGEVPEDMAIPEEDMNVKAPPEDCVGQGEESVECGQEITEDKNHTGEEHCDVAEGLGTSDIQTTCHSLGRDSGESPEVPQVDTTADQSSSKEDMQNTMVEGEKLEEVEPLPLQEGDDTEEDDENEEGLSFDFEDDLESSANLGSGEGPMRRKGQNRLP